MKRIMLILVLPLIIFNACKKDDSTGNQLPQESVLDYMPLTVGNYWIYEIFQCDSGEVNCELLSIDTNLITKDTLINGYTYYKIEGLRLFYDEPIYYRDSGDFMVDNFGTIIFTIKDDNQIYNPKYIVNNNDTILYWYNKLFDELVNIKVSGGDFECLDFKLHFYRLIDNFQIEHTLSHLFSKNVGLVKESSVFVSSLSGRKRELIGYFVHPKSTIIP